MNIPKKQFHIPLPFSPPQPPSDSSPCLPRTSPSTLINQIQDPAHGPMSCYLKTSTQPATVSLKQTQYIVFELLWVDSKVLDWTFFCLSLLATRLLSHPLTHTRPVRDARCSVLMSPTTMNNSSSVSPLLLIAAELVLFSNRASLQCELQMYSFPDCSCLDSIAASLFVLFWLS